MRTYKVFYLTEKNDDCVDFEIEIKAPTIYWALTFFSEKGIVHKRVTSIVEQPLR